MSLFRIPRSAFRIGIIPNSALGKFPLPLLFALTLFVGAFLLFVVQPMVGRMLLPLLGGSPAVWNTCMVFFQAGLLGGYLYAHLSSRCLSTARQALLHLILLLCSAWLVLPIVVDRPAAFSIDQPILGLLATLFLHVGLPFFVLSATAPMLQRWFTATNSPSARDPYFLYVASNFGSLLALLAYPLFFESDWTLRQQSERWASAYVGFIVLIAFCAVCVPNRPRLPAVSTSVATQSAVLWAFRAFIPSSLLLGVTTYLTTDIAPIPLLWVVPLALYLLTFIVAFSTRISLPLGILGRLLSIGVLALVLTLMIGATSPLWLIVPIHLLTFTLAGLLCHGLLARDRPPAEQLTRFYLWIAVGGVLGGSFNGLLAPILFRKLGLVEYPLMLIIVCLLRPTPSESRGWRTWDLLAPLIIGLAAAGLMFWATSFEWLGAYVRDWARQTGMQESMIRSALLFGVPIIAVYTLIDRPRRFALGLAGLLLAGMLDPGPWGKTLLLDRNYLGIVRVTLDSQGRFHRLVHGNTIHGQQRIGVSPQAVAACLLPLSGQPLHVSSALCVRESVWPMPSEPLTYYHPSGPAGDVLRRVVGPWPGQRRIGVVGLGVGSLSAYARQNQEWTFFELDPDVTRIASDERYFTFLRDCRAAQAPRIIEGDARLKLAEIADGYFDLLVLDAFSSDAIPLHLLTAEAMELYGQKLAPGGLLLFHLSNRYLDLPPVVARWAALREKPWISRVFEDLDVSADEKQAGKFASIWAVLAADEKDLKQVTLRSSRWVKIPFPLDQEIWTDDRVDLLGAWRKVPTD